MQNSSTDIVVWAPANGDHSEIRNALDGIKSPPTQNALSKIAEEYSLPALNFIAGELDKTDPGSDMGIRVAIDRSRINHNLDTIETLAEKFKAALGTSIDVIVVEERQAGIPRDAGEAMQAGIEYRYGDGKKPLQKIFDNRGRERDSTP